jgi:hypothetical protein
MGRLIIAGVAALIASSPIASGAQPSDESASTGSRITIRGRVRFGDSSLRPAQPSRIVVHAALAETESLGQVVQAPVADDGTFEIDGVAGPRIIRVGGQGPDDGQWWFESVQWRGRDVTNEPVDFSREQPGELLIVMAARPTAIVGSVEDIAGIPMSGACVVMLPADQDLQHAWSTAVGTTTTDRRGRFYFTGMPPGDYRVEGLGHTCPERGQLLDDAQVFMRRATAVTVGQGKVARIVVTGETADARP